MSLTTAENPFLISKERFISLISKNPEAKIPANHPVRDASTDFWSYITDTSDMQRPNNK